jgi:uncharacterized membrane protein YgcG
MDDTPSELSQRLAPVSDGATASRQVPSSPGNGPSAPVGYGIDNLPPETAINRRQEGKPFAFALAHGINGASIWHGCLLKTCTIVRVRKDGENIVIASQDAIHTVEYIPADNLDENKLLQTHLGWYGNVYGYWEGNDSGEVTVFNIQGPDEPDGEDISELKPDLSRDTPAGKYYVLIGTVEENAPVDQKISSDIPWFVTILRGPNTGSSSSGSSASVSSGSGPGSGSGSTPGSGGSTPGSGGSGSSKSTCIVPCSFHSEKFAALFLPEMPREGVFLDTMEIHLGKRVTVDWIDPEFVEVCEPFTFSVVGWSCGRPIPLGIEVDHDKITITRPWWSKKTTATVMIHAIRKGFLHQTSASPYHHRRLPQRNLTQFVANEAFINSAYPSHD